jgi:hypothetical protein
MKCKGGTQLDQKSQRLTFFANLLNFATPSHLLSSQTSGLVFDAGVVSASPPASRQHLNLSLISTFKHQKLPLVMLLPYLLLS